MSSLQAARWPARGWRAVRAARRSPGRSGSRRRPADGALQCALRPVRAAGRSEIDPLDLRADIGAGYAGSPVRVCFTVLDAITNRPVPNALLDVRHADAPAHGIVITDKEGVARVQTIRFEVAPGVPDGRPTALDVRVFAGGEVAHTGRLRLPEAALAGGVVDAVLRIAPAARRRR